MNLLVNGLFRRVQYTETLVDPQPFQGDKYPGEANQTEYEELRLGDPQGGVIPQERSERQDRHPRGSEEGRPQNRDVPEIVRGQWEVTEAKWNSPTLKAGATVEPNEA